MDPLYPSMDEDETPEPVVLPPQRFRIRLPWHWLLFFCFLAGNFIFFSILSVQISYRSKIADQPYMLAESDVVMVLGASILKDGTPSDALRDRISTAVDLYRSGTVKKILLTGDDGKNKSNEVASMRRAVIALGVPDTDVLIDGQGYRTYESCKNAIRTFHLTHLIVVTQKFHLPRALFLCNELGIDAVGYVADKQRYQSERWFEFRDLLASVKAFWDIYVHNPGSPVPQTSRAK